MSQAPNPEARHRDDPRIKPVELRWPNPQRVMATSDTELVQSLVRHVREAA